MDISGAAQTAGTSAVEALRPAPAVIRVPPPERTVGIEHRAPAAVLAVVLIGLVRGVTAYPIRLNWWLYPVLGIVWLLFVTISEWLIRRDERRHRGNRARFIESLPRSDTESLGTDLGRLWHRLGDPPNYHTVLEALGRAPVAQAQGATIVCLGLVDVPSVDNELFEPVVITPTRYLWRTLWPLPVALAVGILWIAVQPALLRLLRLPLALAGVAMLVWLHRSTLRPTYVRLAPGIVQILRFRFFGGRPTIRSYPLIAGTTAMFVNTCIQTSTRLTLTLARGVNHDELPLKQMRNHGELVEQVWRALLSTAPTPPLSDEELVG